MDAVRATGPDWKERAQPSYKLFGASEIALAPFLLLENEVCN